ncbi:hypothetical protein MKSMC1_31200 [Mycobacterium kansasii]|nr:hypothetical protein MKSMC1_31200 [Mycobacterium kansasii]
MKARSGAGPLQEEASGKPRSGPAASQVGSRQILGDPNSLSGNRFATRLEVPSSRCRNCIADAIMVAKGG